MKEDEINAKFNMFKKEFIKVLGREALYDDEINKVGMRLFKNKWQGVNPQDKINYKLGYQIVNTDTSDKPGEHWIALYITATTIYVFDSFGRSTSKLLKILTKEAKTKKLKIQDSDYDKEQRGSSEVCGVLCLAWLLCVRYFGIQNAMKI